MADRYWIGGTGNWSDTDHWASTSGGNAGTAVVDSYSETNQSSDYWVLNSLAVRRAGQSFSSGAGGVLNSVKFNLKKAAGATGNGYVEIYAHTGTFGTNGVPTGDILATSDVLDISTLSTSYAVTTLTFSGANKITLSPSTYYCAVLYNSGGSSLTLGTDNTSPSHGGNLVQYSVGSWHAETAYDTCFYVYIDALVGGDDVPTSSDDVFIDTNSGFGSGGTITITSGTDIVFKDLTSSTGSSYVIDAGTDDGLWTVVSIYGSVVWEVGPTIIGNIDSIYFYDNSAETFTSNGGEFPMMYLRGSGSMTLLDDLTLTGDFSQSVGSFDANNFNLTCVAFNVYSEGETVTTTLGSGLITTSGDFSADDSSGTVVLQSETSTIKILGEDNSFSGGGKTYYNVWFYGPTPTSSIFVYGDNTFNEIKIEPGVKLDLLDGITETVTSFSAVGESGNLIKLNSFKELDGTTTIGEGCIAEGQSFVGDGGTLHSVSFRGRKNGTPTSNAYAKIYAHTGTFGTDGLPTGAALATSDALDSSTVSTSFEDILFTFSGANKITLTNTTEYFCTLELSDASGGIYVEEINGDAGNAAVSDGVEWSVAAGDIFYVVYKDVDGSPVVMSSYVYSLGQFTLSKSSGNIFCDYLNISNSNATGGADWYAGSHSVDTTNNDGWLFEDGPRGSGCLLALLGIG